MKDTTKVEVIRDCQVRWESVDESVTPVVEVADTEGIDDLSRLQARPATACIYCGSDNQLSREHILAYALGGTTTIPKGSCEQCRVSTHAFETAVLRGPMRMVRYIHSLPSRSRHRDIPDTVPVEVEIDGHVERIDVARDEAPILMPFPVFGLPGYPEPGRTNLQLVGIATGSFGADPKVFGKKHSASKLHVPTGGLKPVAYAQMLAKTAYAAAYAYGLLDRLSNKGELIGAMMHDPNTIGRFVGTMPPPFQRCPGMYHRVSMHMVEGRKILYAIVQLFASIGAPRYVVVLGDLMDNAET